MTPVGPVEVVFALVAVIVSRVAVGKSRILVVAAARRMLRPTRPVETEAVSLEPQDGQGGTSLASQRQMVSRRPGY